MNRLRDCVRHSHRCQKPARFIENYFQSTNLMDKIKVKVDDVVFRSHAQWFDPGPVGYFRDLRYEPPGHAGSPAALEKCSGSEKLGCAW